MDCRVSRLRSLLAMTDEGGLVIARGATVSVVAWAATFSVVAWAATVSVIAWGATYSVIARGASPEAIQGCHLSLLPFRNGDKTNPGLPRQSLALPPRNDG